MTLSDAFGIPDELLQRGSHRRDTELIMGTVGFNCRGCNDGYTRGKTKQGPLPPQATKFELKVTSMTITEMSSHNDTPTGAYRVADVRVNIIEFGTVFFTHRTSAEKGGTLDTATEHTRPEA